MAETKHRVAIIGCGRLGQQYAEAYSDFPETEIVALAEHNPERRKAVGERFGVKALYADAESLLRDVVPDVAAVVTPTKYYKDAVIACAEAGVKGVSCDKPIAAVLADADEMVRVCEERGVVFAGGNLQRAMSEVREAAKRIHSGALGEVEGVALHGWGIQISGGGCQHISVLRLFTGAEVDEVIAWATPQEALESGCDDGLIVNGRFQLSNGMDCPVYGKETPYRGIELWTDRALVRWDWGPPEILEGYDAAGARVRVDPQFAEYPWRKHYYLGTSIRSFLSAIETGSELWVSGHDLRQALEAAVAAVHSARLGSVPVKLPLEDRSLSLLPSRYRWLGGDATGRSQPVEEAAGLTS